jgi:hypothetical protein
LDNIVIIKTAEIIYSARIMFLQCAQLSR